MFLYSVYTARESVGLKRSCSFNNTMNSAQKPINLDCLKVILDDQCLSVLIVQCYSVKLINLFYNGSEL